MSYEKKYIKYKNKYLKLKELSGGEVIVKWNKEEWDKGQWFEDKNYTYDKQNKLLVIKYSEDNTITKQNTTSMKVNLDLTTNYLTNKDKDKDKDKDINKEIKVIIDGSIERIEDDAFYDMNIIYLQFNNLNNTQSQLKYIGKNAFANNKITSLNLPSSIEEIGDNAFANNLIKTFYNNNYKFFHTIKNWGNNVFFNNNIDIDSIKKEMNNEINIYNNIDIDNIIVQIFDIKKMVSNNTILSKMSNKIILPKMPN